MSNAPQTVIHVNNQGTSALGLAGLIFSILGWFTCGLLCIPGAALSILGLLSSKPKGLAIAGLIVGFPGTLFFIFVGASMLAGALGIGAAATGAVSAAREAAIQQAQAQQLPSAPAAEQSPPLDEPSNPEPEATSETATELSNAAPPTVPEPSPSIPPISEPMPTEVVDPLPEPEVKPPPMRRIFTDATGKFRVDATVLAYKDGWLRLHREDTGKDLSVEVVKLSKADQTWVEKNLERLQALK